MLVTLEWQAMRLFGKKALREDGNETQSDHSLTSGKDDERMMEDKGWVSSACWRAASRCSDGMDAAAGRDALGESCNVSGPRCIQRRN